jgi:hypothetical protein
MLGNTQASKDFNQVSKPQVHGCESVGRTGITPLSVLVFAIQRTPIITKRYDHPHLPFGHVVNEIVQGNERSWIVLARPAG